MDTKEYLSQLWNIDNRIKDKMKEANRWRDIAESTGGNNYNERVQTSRKYDNLGDAVAKAVDCENESNELAKELIYLKNKIIKQIDNIGNELYYNILKYYYVEEYGLGRIAVIENYSYKQLKRYYNQALECFEEKYGEEYLNIEKMSTNVHKCPTLSTCGK